MVHSVIRSTWIYHHIQTKTLVIHQQRHQAGERRGREPGFTTVDLLCPEMGLQLPGLCLLGSSTQSTVGAMKSLAHFSLGSSPSFPSLLLGKATMSTVFQMFAWMKLPMGWRKDPPRRKRRKRRKEEKEEKEEKEGFLKLLKASSGCRCRFLGQEHSSAQLGLGISVSLIRFIHAPSIG